MTKYELVEGTPPHPEQIHAARTFFRDSTYMMTEIGDGMFVQWGTCSKCSHRVDSCTCAGGPVPPDHIARWRDERFSKELLHRVPTPQEATVVPRWLRNKAASALNAVRETAEDEDYDADTVTLLIEVAQELMGGWGTQPERSEEDTDD